MREKIIEISWKKKHDIAAKKNQGGGIDAESEREFVQKIDNFSERLSQVNFSSLPRHTKSIA